MEKRTDLIRRSEVLEDFANRAAMSKCGGLAETIWETAYDVVAYTPSVEADPVRHLETSSLVTTNDLDKYKPRIILIEGDIGKGCRVYYEDDPTLEDLVRVVRCKDCTRWESMKGLQEGRGWCKLLGESTNGDFYCQQGERKEAESENLVQQALETAYRPENE